MNRWSAVVVASLLVSTASIADLSYRYKEWADGPVKHLMTRDEWKQWKAIQSDDEATAFIDLFWARRDPTPTTARNEFREEFDQRVAFADRQFSSGRMRGALSDAGKVFILLGPPYRVSGRAGAEAESATIFAGRRPPVDANGQLVIGRATREPDKQYWMYAHERKPKFIGPADFTLVFADEGNNEWKLAHTERVNPDAILQQAAIASIVSPNLTKAPVYAPEPPQRTTTFKSTDLKAAYEQFRSADKQSIGDALVTWGEFVTAEGEHFVSAQLYVPDMAAGKKVTFLTVVENPAGEIVDVREEETSLIAVGHDAYVDRSLALDRGTYNATFAIASGGRLVSASRVPIAIEGLDPAATAVSPLFLASSIVPLKQAWLPDDPFTFGGLKVIPKGDGVFQPSGDLWYFVELRNPGKTDAGTPYVRVQVDIEGKTARGPVALNLPMKDANLARLAGETNRYGLGTAIPLEGFIPGDYRMKVHVVDVVLGKDYRFEKPFRVAIRR